MSFEPSPKEVDRRHYFKIIEDGQEQGNTIESAMYGLAQHIESNE